LESAWKPAWNRGRLVVDRVSDLVVEWGKPLVRRLTPGPGGGLMVGEAVAAETGFT
jgi:hypothetical protein